MSRAPKIAFVLLIANVYWLPVFCQKPKNRIATSVYDFVEPGWKLISKAAGHLNSDSLEDVAIVVQATDTSLKMLYGTDTVDMNKRVLLILFKKAGGGLNLVEKSESFILERYSEYMDDPFDGIAIRNKILHIGFHFWYSWGSWYQTMLEYKFRYKAGQFQLIGAEFNETHRATMENIKRSFNFLTGKFKESKAVYENDANGEQIEKLHTEWKRILPPTLKSMKELSAPLQWKVASDTYI